MSSLGDWYHRRVFSSLRHSYKHDVHNLHYRYPNTDKFPHGLAQLAQDVNAVGCRFGLWIEPEMISEKSVCRMTMEVFIQLNSKLQDLFRRHRDWYFHVPGRPRQVGRNQMVLDLSRKEVRDYLFGVISDLLSRLTTIVYIFSQCCYLTI
jgi:alpha-galactosidase